MHEVPHFIFPENILVEKAWLNTDTRGSKGHLETN